MPEATAWEPCPIRRGCQSHLCGSAAFRFHQLPLRPCTGYFAVTHIYLILSQKTKQQRGQAVVWFIPTKNSDPSRGWEQFPCMARSKPKPQPCSLSAPARVLSGGRLLPEPGASEPPAAWENLQSQYHRNKEGWAEKSLPSSKAHSAQAVLRPTLPIGPNCVRSSLRKWHQALEMSRAVTGLFCCDTGTGP